MKQIKNPILIATMLVTLMTICFTIATFAWLSYDVTEEIDLVPGEFTLEINAYDGTDAMAIENGFYIVNGLSVEDANATSTIGSTHYLENFNISINVTAEITGYLRVKMFDEWEVTRQYISYDRRTTEIVFRADDVIQPFNLCEGWVYDPETKYCYYTNPIEPTTGITIPLIDGGVNFIPKMSSAYYEICQVRISLRTQIVQANRYQALWGIDSLPTGGGQGV